MLKIKFRSELKDRVLEISGEDLMSCYQCGRCTASCPFAPYMDLVPNMVIRFIQLGLDEVVDKNSPWFCATCLTCRVRCPRGIKIPEVMEALREIRLRKKFDYLNPLTIDKDLLVDCPPMGVISAFNKYSK